MRQLCRKWGHGSSLRYPPRSFGCGGDHTRCLECQPPTCRHNWLYHWSAFWTICVQTVQRPWLRNFSFLLLHSIWTNANIGNLYNLRNLLTGFSLKKKKHPVNCLITQTLYQSVSSSTPMTWLINSIGDKLTLDLFFRRTSWKPTGKIKKYT